MGRDDQERIFGRLVNMCVILAVLGSIYAERLGGVSMQHAQDDWQMTARNE